MKSSHFDVAPGVWGSKDLFVNFYFIKSEESDAWALVDTGLKTSAHKIEKIAAELFGADSKPVSIILTHGHFDHVGSVAKLATKWHVPVYAHYMELPYLTGRSSYPPPDPSVGGGVMASLSFMYSRSPINIEGQVEALPEDMSVPGLPGWKWIFTPGHTPGHISLYRESDKLLIVGDAFVTTKAESAMATINQTKMISGPPKYFTPDWEAAEQSVATLAELQPNIAASGHGMPMEGVELNEQLQQLSEYFKVLAVPPDGRYTGDPAVADASGILYVPVDRNKSKRQRTNLLVLGVAVTAAAFTFYLTGKRKKKLFK
jgi:glyoxylase-like metal-dependent hydrolase (beta-lactamase superfamily II)